jgi:dihydrofolate synthase/folylpolyglutamate synthase
MNYDETIEYLYKQLPMFSKLGKHAVKKGLDNIQALCTYLGNPHQKFRSIHIAGTNGKGSTAHMLASIFQSQGYTTGLYTSPHLIDFRERIKLNGDMVSKNYVIAYVKKHRQYIEKLKPSFFEITVAMAFDYFAKNNVDIAIIETGLGGRLDSTNIITPQLSVITNISFDHKDILGHTIAEIAMEKAGIIKKNTSVIIGRRDPEADKVFLSVAKQNNASLYFSEDIYPEQKFILNNKFKNSIYLDDYKSHIENIDYKGYQLENIKTVLSAIKIWNALEILPVSFRAIQRGVTEVHMLTGLHARWQKLQDNPPVVVDVAHNMDGICKAMKNLEYYTFENLWIVYGTLQDKDVSEILPLLPSKAKYLLTQPDTPRRMEVATLSNFFVKEKLSFCTFESPKLALEHALTHATKRDFILVTGSFYVVNEILVAYKASIYNNL